MLHSGILNEPPTCDYATATNIIDIGVAHGEWTRSIKSIFPATPVLMVETRQESQRDLDATVATTASVTCKLALLVAEKRNAVTLHVQGTGRQLTASQPTLIALPHPWQ